MTRHHPSIQEILADPAARRRAEASPERAARPAAIAISRFPGALGGEVARCLGRRLGFEVLDREILHRIAHSAHLNDAAVANLDERDRPPLTEWLSLLDSGPHLSPYGYLEHLRQVIQGAARIGGVILLGRGANLILRSGEALRVLVVAPLEARVGNVMARYGVGAHEAERKIEQAEAQRRAFLKQYFHAELGDHTFFDLVVNTAVLGVEGAADCVQAAHARMPALTPP